MELTPLWGSGDEWKSSTHVISSAEQIKYDEVGASRVRGMLLSDNIAFALCMRGVLYLLSFLAKLLTAPSRGYHL